MRSQLVLFGLTLLACIPCYADPVIVATVGGAKSGDIHRIVVEEARRASVLGDESTNVWVSHRPAVIAVGGVASLSEFRDRIMDAAGRYNEDKSNISLVLVGKSAGAMEIWGALNRYYDEFDDFRRIAVVLVDPHGAVSGDDALGRYDSDDPLSWPASWSSDIDFLRVYHIFQRNFPGASGDVSTSEGLTGAPFPNKKVCRSKEFTSNNVHHMNITRQPETREMIQDALEFASHSRVGIKPHDILLNSRGKDTVDGRRDIRFRLQSDCDCHGAKIKIFQNGVLRTTLSDVEEGETRRYTPQRGREVLFRTHCRRKVVDKLAYLDYDAPTFDRIVVEPNTHRERSMILHADRIVDDGYWNRSDYQVQVTLDGERAFNESGDGVTLNNLSDGRHSATMRIRDGFGRWSDIKSTSFTVSAARPSISFLEPRANASIRRGRDLDISIEAGHASGIKRVSVYLDRISDDEFDSTKICTIPGIFGVGQPEAKTCSPIPVVSSGSLDWSRGRHKLIAVVEDNSGNRMTVERRIRIR